MSDKHLLYHCKDMPIIAERGQMSTPISFQCYADKYCFWIPHLLPVSNELGKYKSSLYNS